MEAGKAVSISDPWDQSFKRVEKYSYQTVEIKGGILGKYQYIHPRSEEHSEYHMVTITNKGRG